VLNVLPSGRKLRANLCAYPADAWGRFLAANHFFPLAAAGSSSKVKQSAAARAETSNVQEGKCLIPW
jgi:hypothetical protein